MASGLSKENDEAQVNTLIYCMGDEADDIMKSFSLSDADAKKYEPVKSKFDNHFTPKRNVIFERARFNSRIQEKGEPVDAFITDLYALAEHCQYGGLRDEMIRDRIVVGIRNSQLSEKLQLDSKLTLESAITEVRLTETVKSQQTLLRRSSSETRVSSIHSGSTGRQNGASAKQKKHAVNKPEQNTCSRCGKSPAHDRSHCPAKDATCCKCKKKGHYQIVCKSSKISGVQSSTQAEAFLGAVQEKSHGHNPWKVTLRLNDMPLEFQIDTGAEVTVISEHNWKDIGRPTLSPPNRILRCPDRRILPTQGQLRGILASARKQAKQTIYVVKGLEKPLLGQPAINELELLTAQVAAIDHQKKSLAEQFPTLFHGLGKMDGEYTIQLQEGARPYALSTPRRVAVPLLNAVRLELERMEKMGVIVKMKEPSEWCSGMVVVPKPNGCVRICVDLTRLNQSVQRELHPLPAVDQILAQLAGAKIFTKLDANSGFWQIPLSPSSSRLTTFITPFGRFCFNRLPFGISSAPEHFQRRMSEILSGIPNTVCMIDDILVYGKTQEEHDQSLLQVLERLKCKGLTLNSDKCQFSQHSIKFLGHIVNESGIKPDPEKVAAILKVRPPSNVGDIRRFLGSVNQLSKFAPNLAEITKPLRDLLVKNNHWTWGEPQQEAFQKVKNALTNSPILAMYNPNLETTISADASSFGLGAVLLQKQLSGDTKPVAYISRSLTPTEQKYAQIEKEALAFTWACERLSDFLVGLKFHIQTDHKPLVPLFSSKHLEELPIRIQRFRLRMMRFDFSIKHVPGKDLVIADTLSRAPTTEPTNSDEILQQEVNAFVNSLIRNLPATEQRLEEIRLLQQRDEACQLITTYCQTGWPRKNLTPEVIKPYSNLSSEFAVHNGLLMRGSRIVIPPSLRRELLQKIHTGHQGITKCRGKARQAVWWPGISKEIEDMVKNCRECCKYQIQHAQPMIPSRLPELPWQKVATDLFEWNKHTYLLIVDYYSRYIEIARLASLTALEVITHTKSIFARHGIPEVVISDNGPQYTAEVYRQFAKEYNFQHLTSSPYYPQGNGEAERAVRTIKDLLKKSTDPYLALLAYRTTPIQGGENSPCNLLMNRMLRTTIPSTRTQRRPKVPNWALLQLKDHKIKNRQKKNFDSYHRARELKQVQPGDAVWIPDREAEAVVEEEVATHSFQLTSEDGSYRRNRRDIIPLPEDTTTRQFPDKPIKTNTSTSSETPELRRSQRISHPPDRLGTFVKP